jgi:hypothetical protein
MKKFKVEYGDDYITIFRYGKEVLHWIEEEWQEDPQVVFSICHAVALAATNKLDKILKEIGKYNIRSLKC